VVIWGWGSVDDLLKCDVRSLAISLQKWVNRRVQETSRKTVGFEVYLARSFFPFYDVEIPPRKVKIPRKASKSHVDRSPPLAEIQKLVMGTRSPRMRLAIMMLALTDMRLGQVPERSKRTHRSREGRDSHSARELEDWKACNNIELYKRIRSAVERFFG